ADNGRIRPALTLPSPIRVVGCCGAPGEDAKSGRLPEQAASRAIDVSAASHAKDMRAGRERQACSPPNMGGSPRRRPTLSPPAHAGNRAFCRGMVNQEKKIV